MKNNLAFLAIPCILFLGLTTVCTTKSQKNETKGDTTIVTNESIIFFSLPGQGIDANEVLSDFNFYVKEASKELVEKKVNVINTTAKFIRIKNIVLETKTLGNIVGFIIVNKYNEVFIVSGVYSKVDILMKVKQQLGK